MDILSISNDNEPECDKQGGEIHSMAADMQHFQDFQNMTPLEKPQMQIRFNYFNTNQERGIDAIQSEKSLEIDEEQFEHMIDRKEPQEDSQGAQEDQVCAQAAAPVSADHNQPENMHDFKI